MATGGLLAAVLAAFVWTAVARAFEAPTVAFGDGFSPLFGDGNLVRSDDDRSVRLLLDRRSGSGFISSDYYHHGFFSAAIKLPKDYTAGVVVAFYLSNGDVYEKTHDEVDFEFLGNKRGKQWRVQTNVYGNGSTDRGREERYLLPFDPTEEPHRYSILWTPTHILFYIDETPIREVIRQPDMGGDYPSKPMAVYATIWDGSAWATDGGKYKVNYKYAPFASHFSDLVLVGCRADPVHGAGGRCAESELELMTADYAVMTPRKRAAMRRFRERHMTYTVCYDSVRYAAGPFPECDNSDEEKERFWVWGESKTVIMKTRGRGRRRNRRGSAAGARSRGEVASY